MRKIYATEEERKAAKSVHDKAWRHRRNTGINREAYLRWNISKIRFRIRRLYRRLNDPGETKSKDRERWLQQIHGISQDDYRSLLNAQRGVCAICGSASNRTRQTKHFHVDHCHSTGKIRGLLCFGCNVALGGVRDNQATLRKMIRYLREHEALVGERTIGG